MALFGQGGQEGGRPGHCPEVSTAPELSRAGSTHPGKKGPHQKLFRQISKAWRSFRNLMTGQGLSLSETVAGECLLGSGGWGGGCPTDQRAKQEAQGTTRQDI